MDDGRETEERKKPERDFSEESLKRTELIDQWDGQEFSVRRDRTKTGRERTGYPRTPPPQ